MNSFEGSGCRVQRQLVMPGHAWAQGAPGSLLEESFGHFCFHCFILLGFGGLYYNF